MSSNPYVKSAMAQAALEFVHPMIRKTLLDDSEFREEYRFRADAVVTLGDSVVSIQRSALFGAIRKILSGVSEIEVTDKEDQVWKLSNESERVALPTLVISREGQRLVLPDFSVLSPDSVTRLCSFDEAAFEVNLPVSSRDKWRSLLSERALADEEVDDFHKDILETPVRIARSIHGELANGKSTVSSLVPHSRRYFERLVGPYDGSASIWEYAAGPGRELFQRLSAWRQYDGFLLSLLLSSHSVLTDQIDVECLASEDLVRAFEYLESYGDRISQLGSIEVGLRVLPSNPEIEPYIIRIIEQIRDDDVDGSASGFKLLSALFFLVDGELSRSQLLSVEIPFYRRLTSLSQAALIQRQLVTLGIEDDSFYEWASNIRREQYYFQSLADMRFEPRWHPDLAAASQMKADFFGRIMIAAKKGEKNIKNGELHELVLGTESGSLYSASEFPRPYLPGPLEGSENNPNTMPAELSEAIEAQLKVDEVGPLSFITLVNSALIFRVDSEQAELAGKALKLGSYRLANVEGRSQLIGILHGLAAVAAAARSWVLADELRMLVRRYRHDSQYGLSVEEAIRICLVAAASHADLNGWREFVGDCLTELAFDDLAGDDGDVLFSHLRCLCHVVPELWITCGRADAALMAYNDS